MKNKYLANEYHSLWLFFSLMIIYALVYMTKNCFSAAMVRLVDEGVLTKTQTGSISAAFYLVYAPFQIIGGIAADKYPPHKLIAIGLVGATVANVLIVVNTNYYFMLAIWAINGAVQFGVWPAVFKMTSSMLAPVHRHKGVFYIVMAGTLGLIFSYVLAGMVGGWQSNFIVAAIVLLICSIYWIPVGGFFDKNMTEEEENYHGVAHMPENQNSLISKDIGIISLLIKSGLILIFPVAIMQTVLNLGIQSVTPSMIAESYDSISPSLASILTIVPVVMGVFGKFVMKWIYARTHHTECSVLAIAIFIAVPVIAAMLFIGQISVIVIVCLVSLAVLIANAAYLIINPYMVVPFSKIGKNATVSGVLNAMASLGIVVANLTSTAIADSMGWKAVIVSWIIFALVSGVIVMIAYYPWKKFLGKIGN